MRKLLSVILLILILLNSAGIFIYFQGYRYHFRNTLKNSRLHYKNTQLVQLTFDENTVKQIRWIEKDREFIHNGIMYDIIETKTINGAITFFCYEDKKETELLAAISDIMQNDKSNSLLHTVINHLLHLLYFDFYNTHRYYANSAPIHAAAYIFISKSHQSEPPAPPPRGIL